MRHRFLRIFGISVALFVLVEIGSCRAYDAFVRPVEANGLVRTTIAAPSGYTISYIAAAVHGADELPRILYVHGTPGDATAFEDYLATPIPGFDAVSIDRPGFGHTTPRAPVYTLKAQAESLEPLLVRRADQGTILVGHSLGGPIIVETALCYPDRVGGLVILSGSLDPAFEKIAWYQRVANFAFIPYMIPYFLRNANRELLPLKVELEALRPRLKDLQCPIVIVHAPDDILVPYENVDYMRAEFPKDTIVDVMTLDGKSHWVPWNAETEVREAIGKIIHAIRPMTEEAIP